MTIVVVKDPKDREREEASRRRLEELQKLVEQRMDKEPHIVMETTCPTCGHKRYVPLPTEEGK